MYGWEGEKTRLVPLDPDRHLENALRWLNDPEVTRWTSTGDFPLSRLAEEEYFRTAQLPAGAEVHFAVETLDGEHIGFSGLLRVDFRHGVASSGSFIGRSDMWGRGLGTDAARVRTRYAFEVLGLRLILADVIDGNERSLRMLRRVGYQLVGRIPGRYFKRGAYRDQIILALGRELSAFGDQLPASPSRPHGGTGRVGELKADS